jgi:hypothetical protein
VGWLEPLKATCISKNVILCVHKRLFQIQVLYYVKVATRNVIIVILIQAIALNASFREDMKLFFIIIRATTHVPIIILQTMIQTLVNALLR